MQGVEHSNASDTPGARLLRQLGLRIGRDFGILRVVGGACIWAAL